MPIEFALLAQSGPNAVDKRFERFVELEELVLDNQKQGSVYKDATLGIWSNEIEAIQQSDHFALCGRARLDNRPELLTFLKNSADLQDLSDLELVSRLCVAQGSAALSCLSGSFSLALWEKENRTLHVIRDHFGVYPLYLAERDGAVVVSSNLRLTAHLDAQPLKPCEGRISAYLAGFEDSETNTAFVGLDRFPRAHVMEWQPGRPKKMRRYWQLTLPQPIPLTRAVPAVRKALERAVIRRRGAAANTGCMLSGGLDSSSLAVLAAQAGEGESEQDRGTLRTFSFVYRENDSYDESSYIAEVNEQIEADPVLIRIDGPPNPVDLPLLLDEQFDLCTGPGLLKSRRIYSEARAHGMAALLDGHGGDEVISHGYHRLAELSSQGAYWTLWCELRGASRVYGQHVLGPYLGYLHRYAPLKPRGIIRRAIGWVGRRLPVPHRTSMDPMALLDVTYATTQDIETRALSAEENFGPYNGAPDERQAHLRTLVSPITARAFETLHRSAAAQGIEPLYPFFDKDLVELCLQVPPEGKLRKGWSRWILREAMAGLLPRRIQWRRDKADFNSEIAAFVLAYLDDPERIQRLERRLKGVIDMVVFHDWSNILRQKSPRESAPVVQLLWQAIYLAAWFERLEQWNKYQNEGRLW